VCGLLNNAIPYSLLAFSEIRLSAGLASILNATTPIFGIIVAHFLTSNERFSAQRLLGVLLGFAGVAVLIGPGVAAGLATGGTGRLIAEAACLVAAMTYAFGSVFSRNVARHSTLTIATGQVTASAVLMVVPVALFDRPWTLPMPDADVIGSLVTIGLICTAFAYLLFFRIMRVAGVTNILLVTLLVPVSALLLGAALLHETVRPNAYVGMALIGSGLLAIDGRVLRVMRLRAA